MTPVEAEEYHFKFSSSFSGTNFMMLVPTTTIAEIFRLQFVVVAAFVLFAKGYRIRVMGWEVRNLTTVPC